MSDQEFIDAIQRGDVAFLEEYLTLHPEQISQKLPSWSVPNGRAFNYGLALHCAAACNQPALVELFVKKYKADINQSTSGTEWTPLHYAADAQAYEASVTLIKLGADINKSGVDTLRFHQTEKMKELLEPDYQERKRRAAELARQKKIAGTWARTTPQEVVHDYELPEQRYRLTDIFNFETRFWQRTTQDQRNNGIANNITFFDDMPDKTILHQAAEKLRELGGDVDDSAIDYQPIRGKQLRPKN